MNDQIDNISRLIDTLKEEGALTDRVQDAVRNIIIEQMILRKAKESNR